LEKSYRYAGEKRTKRILAETEKKPVTFEKIARGTNDYFWYRRTVSEGTKGPIAYEFMKKRVVLAKDGQPDQKVWLIVRRTLGERRHLFLLHFKRRQIHPVEDLRLAFRGSLGH